MFLRSKGFSGHRDHMGFMQQAFGNIRGGLDAGLPK